MQSTSFLRTLAVLLASVFVVCAFVAASPRSIAVRAESCSLWIDPTLGDPPHPYCSGTCNFGNCESMTINQGGGLWTTHCVCDGSGTNACSGVFYLYPDWSYAFFCDTACLPPLDCLEQIEAPWAFQACDCQ